MKLRRQAGRIIKENKIVNENFKIKPEYSKFTIAICTRAKTHRRKVRRIIEDVKLNGDEAVVNIKRFDKIRLSAQQLKVEESEISGAFKHHKRFCLASKVIISNVSIFINKSKTLPHQTGQKGAFKENILPIESVGFIFPLVPPPLNGLYDSHQPRSPALSALSLSRLIKTYQSIHLAVANLLKVNEIYRAGTGSRGTDLAPNHTKVDKIIGLAICT